MNESRCIKCGYDLRGLVVGGAKGVSCPECGERDAARGGAEFRAPMAMYVGWIVAAVALVVAHVWWLVLCLREHNGPAKMGTVMVGFPLGAAAGVVAVVGVLLWSVTVYGVIGCDRGKVWGWMWKRLLWFVLVAVVGGGVMGFVSAGLGCLLTEGSGS